MMLPFNKPRNFISLTHTSTLKYPVIRAAHNPVCRSIENIHSTHSDQRVFIWPFLFHERAYNSKCLIGLANTTEAPNSINCSVWGPLQTRPCWYTFPLFKP